MYCSADCSDRRHACCLTYDIKTHGCCLGNLDYLQFLIVCSGVLIFFVVDIAAA